ncbi:MAG: glycoside hydrolase [Crocinitomicaceae bacterium]|nr:glycoside hydrolase [Crocinitomicaceae bacterium]
MKNSLIFILFFLSFSATAQKIKGLSFVGAPEKISMKNVKPMVEVGAEWAALMPYGFIQNKQLIFNSKYQWYGEREEGLKETVDLCQKAGLKIMIKPQVWIPRGYTGHFELETDAEWKAFETSYTKFILTFAKAAEEKNVELFCIGTEWEKFVRQRPEYWNELIDEIRTVYSGEITYAANWDEFTNVPFWDKLDHVGIDAYFPVAASIETTPNELSNSWRKLNKELGNYSNLVQKKIIFTEIGYRSIAQCVTRPWEAGQEGVYSEYAQLMAYQAMLENVWEEDWFEGLFLWKWHHNHEDFQKNENRRFTPQGKLAAQYLKEFWTKN